jgi:hypothetical protein
VPTLKQQWLMSQQTVRGDLTCVMILGTWDDSFVHFCTTPANYEENANTKRNAIMILRTENLFLKKTVVNLSELVVSNIFFRTNSL